MQPQTIGPYVVLRTLGSGGMGTVYLGQHSVLGREDAIKVPHARVRADADAMERFRREGRAAATLHHPHVVAIRDASVEADPPYLAMEYVEGPDLRELLTTHQVLTPQHVVALLTPIATALDDCHAHGQVHRDIKPANILIGRRNGADWPVLTDFGIARASHATPLTGTGQVLGTPQYLSPEQASGRVAVPASDLYALACVAYECLTGGSPFRRDTEFGTLEAHVYAQAPPPSSVNPRLPEAIDAVFADALAKDPVARMARVPSATAFMTQLDAALGEPPEVRSDEETGTTLIPGGRQPGPVRRRRTGLVVLGFAAAAAVVLPGAWLAGQALSSKPLASAPPKDVAKTDPLAGLVLPGQTLSPAEEALLRQGPLSLVTNCVPQPTIEIGVTTAAVGCDSRDPGAAGILLRQSTPGAALTDHMDTDRPQGDCASQVGVDGSWSLGPLDCYHNNKGVATLWWGYSSSGINIVATRGDGSSPDDTDNRALYDWWHAGDWTSPSGPAA